MKTLQLSEQQAREMYKTASTEIKSILEANFDKQVLIPSVEDRLQTAEDCCLENGNPVEIDWTVYPEKYRTFMRGVWRNVNICEALNEGERMDIYNEKERHYPWFECNGSPSSFAFNRSGYGNAAARAGSGSLLSLKDAKLSRLYGTRFKEEARIMLES